MAAVKRSRPLNRCDMNNTPKVPAEAAALILNKFLEQAPDACKKLLNQRVPVPDAVCDDSLIVVFGEAGSYKVGLLGVINGIMGELGDDRVVSVHDEKDQLLGFTNRASLKK